MMTPRERVLTTLKRTGIPDKTPYEISWAFTPPLMKTFHSETGSDMPPEEYYDFDIRYVLPGPTKQKADFTLFFKEGILEENASFDEWGVGSVPALFEIPDYRYHPLRGMSTIEEINNYPWPDLGEAYRYEDVARQTRVFQDRGYPVYGEMYQTIFETAWLMRDMQPSAELRIGRCR